VCRVNGAYNMAVGLEGEGGLNFFNGLDDHDLLQNLVDERHKALDVNCLDRPVSRYGQWVFY
ncbi:MAG: hypothetical protein WCO04_16975, partial [Pseudomonadota bacterium]